MEKYFKTLSEAGQVEIPKQFTEKLGWNENTRLFQFTRAGTVYITDREPEQSGYSSQLDGSSMLTIQKELLDEAGFGFDENLAVYEFINNILGLAKDFRECVICGKTSELAPVKDKHICYDCSLLASGIDDNTFK